MPSQWIGRRTRIESDAWDAGFVFGFISAAVVCILAVICAAMWKWI